MEELDALDQKALEQQYLASYHYTAKQKMVGSIAVIVFVLALIALGTILFVNIIDIFTK